MRLCHIDIHKSVLHNFNKMDKFNDRLWVVYSMRITYVSNEFKSGTTYRRIYLFEDDGDVIMTEGTVYEDDIEDDAYSDVTGYEYDGPEDDWCEEYEQ